MSEIKATNTPTGNHKSFVAVWPGAVAGDTFAPLDFSQYTDKSVQVSGAFDAATCVLEGSNDGANYHPLHDYQGATLSFGTAGLKPVAEACRYVRPALSGGGGLTSLTVSLFLKA
jgi:hypothetical protein